VGSLGSGSNRMFEIKFTDRALEDLEIFSKSEQKQILTGLESQLTTDAAQENDDRKRLHSDGLAEWEIRLGNVRVFYDVDIRTGTVKIEAVGKSFLK
jgi:mRNA-degrading endonuclease RelE of RelBE toxin-antitoxin system